MNYNKNAGKNFNEYLLSVYQKDNIDLLETIDLLSSNSKNVLFVSNLLDSFMDRLMLHPTNGVINFKSNAVNKSIEASIVENCKIGILFLSIGYQNNSNFLTDIGMEILKPMIGQLKNTIQNKNNFSLNDLNDLRLCIAFAQKFTKNKHYNIIIKKLFKAYEHTGTNVNLSSDLENSIDNIIKRLMVNEDISKRDIILSQQAINLINKPFNRTMTLLTRLISKKKHSDLISRLLSVETKNHANILLGFIDSLKSNISEQICAQMEDLYHYERKIWNFNLSFENRQKLMLEDIIHEQNKYVFFGVSNNVFLSKRFKVNTRFKKIKTKWEWIQNSVIHIEEINPSKQLFASGSSYLNGVVVSGFSTRGYFEYYLSEYDEFVLNLFNNSNSVVDNFNILISTLKIASKKEEIIALKTFRSYVDKLLDRNILFLYP